MNIADIDAFVGTWRAEPDVRLGFSGHTIVWEVDNGQLQGHWTIQAADTSSARAVTASGVPSRLDVEISEPRIENGVLIFRLWTSPFDAEFRLLTSSHAIVGPSGLRRPARFKARFQPAIAGHQVHLTRQSEDRHQ